MKQGALATSNLILTRTDEGASGPPIFQSAGGSRRQSFDGYRALACKTGEETRLVSRNQVGFKFPELIDAIKLLPAEQAVIDGEITALDHNGQTFFPASASLRNRRNRRARPSPRFSSKPLCRNH